MNILIGLIAIIIIGIIILLFISRARKKKGLSKRDHAFIAEKWNEICETAKIQGKHAIIEADKLLDHVLSKKGFQGTVAEKLRKAEGIFRDKESVWSAHKLRNRIAHEMDVNLHDKRVEQTLVHFKKAIKDLGAKI